MKIVYNIYVAVRKLWNAIFGKNGDGSSVELIKGNPTVTAEAPNLTSVEINGTKYKIELSAEQVQEAVNAYLSGDPSVFQDVVAPLIAPEYDDETAYKVGNLLTYLGKQYYTIKDTTAGTLPTNTEYFEEKSVADIIEMIRNGSIVTGHSEVADNLTPYSEDSGTTQENPFISQGTGTDNNSVIVTTGVIAKQLEKQGNTVVKNQLINISDTSDTNKGVAFTSVQATRKITISGTPSGTSDSYSGRIASRFKFVEGHKYLITITKTGTRADLVYCADNNSFNATKTYTSKVFTATSAMTAQQTDMRVYCAYEENAVVNAEAYVTIVDLTQWGFSSDIITDLTSHPEHFSWYYNGSLAYDAGSLQNCNGRYLECGQGRNLFNGTFQLGKRWTTSGEFTSGTNNFIACEEKTQVVPNTAIAITCVNLTTNSLPTYVVEFDKDKNYIGMQTTYLQTATKFRTVTVTPNTEYVALMFYSTEVFTSTAQVTPTDISLYYTPEEGGEGYNQHYDYVAPIRIDTGNETLKAFDKKLPSGVIERNGGNVVDASTMDWTADEGFQNRFYVSVASLHIALSSKIICSKYIQIPTSTSVANMTDKTIKLAGSEGSPILYAYDSSCDTLEEFLEAIDGMSFEFTIKDAYKTTEQGTPFSEYAPINDYSYMAWFDTDGNLVSIPQGCKLFYPVDYKGFVDDLVMYTNGDATALAKEEDITDLALNARGYYKMQDLLSSITDVAGLTYLVKSGYSIGKVATIFVDAKNETGSTINANTVLFTVPAPLSYIVTQSRANGQFTRIDVGQAGQVLLSSETLPDNANVSFILTYILA